MNVECRTRLWCSTGTFSRMFRWQWMAQLRCKLFGNTSSTVPIEAGGAVGDDQHQQRRTQPPGDHGLQEALLCVGGLDWRPNRGRRAPDVTRW